MLFKNIQRKTDLNHSIFQDLVLQKVENLVQHFELHVEMQLLLIKFNKNKKFNAFIDNKA